MRLRQLLLVHPSRGFRGLIKKFIFAEFNDVEIVETDTCQAALAQALTSPFSAVLSSVDADLEAAHAFMLRLKESPPNARTPFIALCAEECRKTNAGGPGKLFEHLVHIRQRPADLIQKLNEVCNPRRMRKDARFYLPNAVLIIGSGHLQAKGRLINISRGGVLVELRTDAPQLLVKSALALTLRPDPASGMPGIENLNGKLLRIDVADWHPDNTPVAMRVTFLFTGLTADNQTLLETLLVQAEEDQAREGD